MTPLQISGILISVAFGGVVAHQVIHVLVQRSLQRHGRQVARSLVGNLRGPTRLVIPLAALEVAVGVLRMPPPLGTVLVHAVGIAMVVAVAWLVVRATFVLDDVLLARYEVRNPDNLRARRVQTQIQVLRRITVLTVSVLALAIVLLSFPQVRAAGAGLLASAGLVGLAVGIAARPVATNVVAGLQIALSQPIRVDDVVVVEGHWGRIEEIALTYVVVRIWDLRRLVVPVSYFVTNPFENWTRSTADILGWVYLEVDYGAPVAAIRARFEDVLSKSPDWDGKVSTLQVTDLGSHTMQLRALMSASDSSKSWDLQCHVREQLVAFLQQDYPWALPRLRTQRTDPMAGRPADHRDMAGDGPSRTL